MKSAVIFDMDGVLVDNRDIHIDAFMVLCDKYGMKTTREAVLMEFGKTNIQIFKALFGESAFTDEQIAKLGVEKEQIYRDIFEKKIAPAKGLVPLLEGLKKKGIKIAVGSSGPLSNVKFVLEKCGIESYFDAIANGDMISRGKPDPEVFLLAAKLLGVTPNDCIVFEDAIVGIEAAKRADMVCIAMDTTFPRDMLSGYDMMISDFTEVDASITEKW